MYGKLEPTTSSVSQSLISSYDGRVPSRPMEPVTQSSSSDSTSLPSSAFATPAPRRSATVGDLLGGSAGALTDQDRHLLARVEDLGGPVKVRPGAGTGDATRSGPG